MEGNTLRKIVDPQGLRGSLEGSGRGIVICAGGTVLLTNAYVLIRVLREDLNCTAPIEIWHAGQAEIPHAIRAVFEELSCTFKDAYDTDLEPGEPPVRDGWHLKLHALKYASFAEVLMIDADQVPVRDPMCVFDWEGYGKTGAVFWPDVVAFAETSTVWEVLGLPQQEMVAWESGQLCVDRLRHGRAIGASKRILENADAFAGTIYGDKDALGLGWLVTEASHLRVPHLPFVDQKQLGQRDLGGALLFQHRTNCKFTLTETPIFVDGFVYADKCLTYLEALRSVWNERVFSPPPRSVRARQLEDELIAMGSFKLADGAARVTDMTLLRGHQIGDGRTAAFQNWHVHAPEDGPAELVFHGFASISGRIAIDGPPPWTGQGASITQAVLLLDPVKHDATHDVPAVFGLVHGVIKESQKRISAGCFDPQVLAGALSYIAALETGVLETFRKEVTQIAIKNPSAAGLLEQAVDLAQHRADDPLGQVNKNWATLQDATLFKRL